MVGGRKSKKPDSPCQWISETGAFKEFATHAGKTQSARHIKPLHWYIACRLVIEGGFHPDSITPRPPFKVDIVRSKKSKKNRYILSYDPTLGLSGEQVILGGLKTKNVDVVVNLHHIGPVLAVSCKGVTKAFRNLTNRMEETIGECTNLHITYPAMVIGYFAVMRANRTLQDAVDAADMDESHEASESDETDVVSEEVSIAETVGEIDPSSMSKVSAANDIAVDELGLVSDGIVRFHAALCEMTGRRGIRDEISRYEAMTIVLVEPKGDQPGSVFAGFPDAESPLQLSLFFKSLYQRYEERFVYGAPLLADRGITTRLAWDPNSPVFQRGAGSENWPVLNFNPRLSDV
jgi:hypothetical protein